MNPTMVAIQKLLNGEAVFENSDSRAATKVLELLASMGEIVESKQGTTRWWRSPYHSQIAK